MDKQSGKVSFKVVIPARFESSRLPGKVLREIAGKPMLQHVYQRAVESGAQQIVIATDHEEVFQVAREFGAEVCMTGSEHCSGTDRIAEVCQQYRWSEDTVIVNLQGDEPLMEPALLYQVAQDLIQQEEASISTLSTPVTTVEEVLDPNIVKVVADQDSFALYFSRAPIPWDREQFSPSNHQNASTALINNLYQRHLGIYAYRSSYLNLYQAMAPCDLERLEALEQLRALWYGHKIHVSSIASPPGHGVDTEKDLERVVALFNRETS